MIDKDHLLHGYDLLKTGSLYKKWASQNPGEAQKLDAYITDIADDGKADPPTLATPTGQAFVEWVSMFDVETEAPTPPPTPPLAVTSSLTNGPLTAPVEWSAVPSAPVSSVDFLIDGVTKWTEHIAPFIFNGDPDGKLDPGTLTNGPHLFTVVATTAAGEKATASATVAVDVALPPPPPPPADGSEGRVNFWMYGTSQVDPYVTNPTQARKDWMKAHWQRLEGWLESEAAWHPGVMRYDDMIQIYVGSSTATQHPDWILKHANGSNVMYNGHYLADIGKPEYQDFKAAECAAFMSKGFKGIKADDVNLDRVVSGPDVINPRTKAAYTLPEWQADNAALMTKVKTKVKAADAAKEIAHNSLWWSSGPEVIKCMEQANLYQLERGFNDTNYNAAKIQQVWAFVDKLHSLGLGAIHLSEAGGVQEAHFNLACALLCSNGHDYAYGVGWKPDAWDPIYDTDLGAKKNDRYLVSGYLWRRDFANGYATADLAAKVGTIVKTG